MDIHEPSEYLLIAVEAKCILVLAIKEESVRDLEQ